MPTQEGSAPSLASNPGPSSSLGHSSIPVTINTIRELKLQREQQQKAVLSTGSAKRSAFETPADVLQRKRSTFKEFYSGYDALVPKGLNGWQLATIDQICVTTSKLKISTKKLRQATTQEMTALEHVENLQYEANTAADVSLFHRCYSYINIGTDVLFLLD